MKTLTKSFNPVWRDFCFSTFVIALLAIIFSAFQSRLAGFLFFYHTG